MKFFYSPKHNRYVEIVFSESGHDGAFYVVKYTEDDREFYDTIMAPAEPVDMVTGLFESEEEYQHYKEKMIEELKSELLKGNSWVEELFNAYLAYMDGGLPYRTLAIKRIIEEKFGVNI